MEIRGEDAGEVKGRHVGGGDESALQRASSHWRVLGSCAQRTGFFMVSFRSRAVVQLAISSLRDSSTEITAKHQQSTSRRSLLGIFVFSFRDAPPRQNSLYKLLRDP